MTVQEFYETIGGDYTEALSRLMNDKIATKFILKYPNDQCFQTLKAAVASGDWEASFKAAHTLKGVVLNLSFKQLGVSACAITEALRGWEKDPIDGETIKTMLADVEKDYNAVIDAINQLQA